ncbi:hypothetical protein IOQ59_10185 [Pontibacterium sp. N1Y112]|uniref:Uncharacterized protein n=1 Tax=Pontibacterium sinense TaxID=2781979 RepID=A0A8J7FHA1_9GAMM|nr:hypothetical protein [Pontibacterium sinense]MBE9397628.1 hypothetical protein [Pontibacterium sinense]
MTSVEVKNGQVSKWNYSEGGKSLDGSVISHIVGREEDFIIFYCEDGALSWEHRDIPDWAYSALEQYEKLNSKIPSYLGQIHKSDIKSKMAISLLSAFRSRKHDETSILNCFEEAMQFVSDFESRDVLFAGEGFYLFEKDGNLLSIESSLSDELLDKAFIEASYLSQQAKHSLSGDKLHQSNRLIANAFSSYKKCDEEDIFSKANDFIETQVNDSARINYLSISVFVSFIACLILLLVYYNAEGLGESMKKIILCSFAGVIGATISILQRSKEIKPMPYSSNALLGFQGVVRIFLGVVFGALVPVCANADIALGLAKDNVNAIFLVAFFAGINERFIPDLLEKNVSKPGL